MDEEALNRGTNPYEQQIGFFLATEQEFNWFWFSKKKMARKFNEYAVDSIIAMKLIDGANSSWIIER
jgi:hypothetical protein